MKKTKKSNEHKNNVIKFEGEVSKVFLHEENEIEKLNKNDTVEINNDEELKENSIKDTKNENAKDIEIELSSDVVNEKIENAFEAVSPKKRKKSIIVSLVFLVFNVVFMYIVLNSLLSNMDNKDLISIFKSRGENLWWLAGGIGIYVLYFLVQVLMYYFLIKSLAGQKRIKLSYDVAVLGKYYDNVTPFAVGGQPMQIVKLAKSGLSAGISTSIPTIKMVTSSIVNITLIVLFFVFGIPMMPAGNELNGILLLIFEILAIIGLVINVLLNVFIVLLSSGSFVTRSFICSVLRVGYKLKLVKNYRQTLRKTINQVAEYRSSMKLLTQDKVLFFKLVLLGVCESLFYALMPYFVLRAFVTTADAYTFGFLISCLIRFYICSMASSYIPLPGGTGMYEISFIFLFGIIAQNDIVWVLLIWRILSYYMILAHGFVHEMINIISSLIKNKKQNLSNNL